MSRRLPSWQRMASHSHLVQQFLRQTNSWGDLFHLPGRRCRSYNQEFPPERVRKVGSRPAYSSPRNRVGCSEEVRNVRGSPHQRILAQNNLLVQQGFQKPTYSRKRLEDLATPKRKLFPTQKISPSNLGEVLRRSVRSTKGDIPLTNPFERYIQGGSFSKKPLKVKRLESSLKKSSQRNLEDLFGELDSRSLSTYIVASDRLVELARSKKMEEPVPSKSCKLNKVMRSFKPSQRLLERHESGQRSWCALRYKASPRISQLAGCSRKIQSDCLICTKSEIRGPTPQRLNELAKPKLRKDNSTRSSPFQVPSRALNAKITPRLIELARPRL
ncbi:uncharacterized protein [Drosophila bipectinata]|uniref:uncharacterized protein n=1 Tax=Drosophila bipectinata TaxID=42026 RepID=UPI0038B2A750